MQAVMELDESDVSATEKMVLIAIFSQTNDRCGWAWPGLESIAKKSCMTVSGVIKIIARLSSTDSARKQVLIKDAFSGPRGTNRYCLMAFSNGSYNPPQINGKREVTGVHPPEREVTGVHPGRGGTRRPPELIKDLILEEEEERVCVEWPSLEDVLKVAVEYAGSMSKGIPAIIPRPWAEYHFHHRTHERQSWAKDWKAAMVSLFELHWQNNQPAARGQNPLRQTGFGVQKKNGRERGEILQELAAAKKTGAPVEQLQRELAAA